MYLNCNICKNFQFHFKRDKFSINFTNLEGEKVRCIKKKLALCNLYLIQLKHLSILFHTEKVQINL